MSPVIGQKVIFFDAQGNRHDAEIVHVWSDQCVNLKVDDGSQPTSVMHISFFPNAANGEHTHFVSGHYWLEKPTMPYVKPSVGRIVHFVLKDRFGHLVHRPAIIVRYWPDEGLYVEQEGVQLQVFTDGSNDGPQFASGLFWATSVYYDEAGDKEYTWHWPEREE